MSKTTTSGPTLEQRLSGFAQEDPALRPSNLWVRAVTWSLVATTGFAVGWLALAKTEEIVVAPGKLEPIGAVKEIQLPVGGVTKAILVKEGQAVKTGQVLLQLDTEASRQRLRSLIQSIGFKQEQLSLKQAEIRRYLALNDAETSMLSKQLALDQLIFQRLEQLQQQGATAELQYLQQRNKVEEARGKLDQSRNDRLRQVAVLDQQIEQLRAELADLRTQQAEAALTLRYQAVRSPVDGVVFDLKPTATGFTAQTATAVMKVVPQNALEATVLIDSSKIGFVRRGMAVDLSIDSFPAHDFGVLHGSVRQIGSDALEPGPEVRDQGLRFPAKIRLASQKLRLSSGTTLPLQAGMGVKANIKLRRVSYLQLLLSSFRDKAQSLQQL